MGGGTRLGVTGIVGGWGDEVRGHWSRLGNFTKRRLGNLTKRRYHDDQSISRFFILWLEVAPNFSVFFCEFRADAPNSLRAETRKKTLEN